MHTNNTNTEEKIEKNDGSQKMNSCCGETTAEKVGAENSTHTFQRSCCQ